MKPLRTLVVEVGGVPLCQLLDQEGRGCRLLFMSMILMLDAVFCVLWVTIVIDIGRLTIKNNYS